MPLDWRARATDYTTPDGLATAVCPSAEDIAIAKLCAWREKDQVWLREAFRSGVAKTARATALLHGEMPDAAPARDELIRRMNVVSPEAGRREPGLHPRRQALPPGEARNGRQTSPESVRHLPQAGSVLGLDVGFSTTRRSSAVCRIDWDEAHIGWKTERFRALPAEQESTLVAVAGGKILEAAAFDGPLRAGLDVIGVYRVADRMLTRRLGARIGKPGQTNAPVGKRLNAAANDLARLVRRTCLLQPSQHANGIDSRAIVEAFPNSFLGVMLEDPSLVPARRDDRSDTFFLHLVSRGTLQRLLCHLLPDRTISLPLDGVTNHDDRAALICALPPWRSRRGTLPLSVTRIGWIVLPPRVFVQNWAWNDLEINARAERPGCLHRSEPRR